MFGSGYIQLSPKKNFWQKNSISISLCQGAEWSVALEDHEIHGSSIPAARFVLRGRHGNGVPSKLWGNSDSLGCTQGDEDQTKRLQFKYIPTSRWFHFFLIFTPIWGRFPIWLFFQIGWKHQLVEWICWESTSSVWEKSVAPLCYVFLPRNSYIPTGS